MNIEQPRWISTVSVSRFHDHCYLIECAYHIISKYCCSFTNLLAHDDGSIPYYLVQKVKIAIEYGKILLDSRYKPFQYHLRRLGAYEYIDRVQYEGLCVQWNVIKMETQVVEMYFNQISLLIYPVVSAATSSSTCSSLFTEYKNNEKLSALTKINVIVHKIMSCEETTQGNKQWVGVCGRKMLPTTGRQKYFSEQELEEFIVQSIIEPLFIEEPVPRGLVERELMRTAVEADTRHTPALAKQRNYDYHSSRYKVAFPKFDDGDEKTRYEMNKVQFRNMALDQRSGNGIAVANSRCQQQFEKKNGVERRLMDEGEQRMNASNNRNFRKKSKDWKLVKKAGEKQIIRNGYELASK